MTSAEKRALRALLERQRVELEALFASWESRRGGRAPRPLEPGEALQADALAVAEAQTRLRRMGLL